MSQIKPISKNSINNKKIILEIVKELPDFFTYDGVEKELEETLKKDIVFGAFKAKKLVGFITYRKADKSVLEITWLAVLPEFQNQGIGYRLVKKTLNDFALKGYRICYVKTLAVSVKIMFM